MSLSRSRRRIHGRDVDEQLLGVPGEEGAEIRVEVELDLCVFLAFGRVVVRAAFDDLDVADGDCGRGGGCGGREGEEGEESDYRGEGEGAGGHEPEGILEAGEGVVHCGAWG